jgi:hypothetical protein
MVNIEAVALIYTRSFARRNKKCLHNFYGKTFEEIIRLRTQEEKEGNILRNSRKISTASVVTVSASGQCEVQNGLVVKQFAAAECSPLHSPCDYARQRETH